FGSVVASGGLAARVPGGYAALWIEHVDRAILDGVDDEPRPLLALAQCLLDMSARLDVLDEAGIGRREGACAVARGLEQERTQPEQGGQRGAQRERCLGEYRIRPPQVVARRRHPQRPANV